MMTLLWLDTHFLLQWVIFLFIELITLILSSSFVPSPKEVATRGPTTRESTVEPVIGLEIISAGPSSSSSRVSLFNR